MYSRRRQRCIFCCFGANRILFCRCTLGGRGGTKKKIIRHILSKADARESVRPPAVNLVGRRAIAVMTAAVAAVTVSLVVVAVRKGVPLLSLVVRLAYGHHLAATSTSGPPLGVLFPHPAVTLVYLLHMPVDTHIYTNDGRMQGRRWRGGRRGGGGGGGERGGVGHFVKGDLCCIFWRHTKSIPDACPSTPAHSTGVESPESMVHTRYSSIIVVAKTQDETILFYFKLFFIFYTLPRTYHSRSFIALYDISFEYLH